MKRKKILFKKPKVDEINNNLKELNFHINNSVIEGINKKKSYKIRAKTVTKKNNSIYNLNHINAVYDLLKDKLYIIADNALLNETSKILILSQNVKVISKRFLLTTSKVNLDFNSKLLSGSDSVEVIYQTSTIRAANFCWDDFNNVITFKGNVLAKFNIKDF